MSELERYRRISKGSRDIEEYGFGMEQVQSVDVEAFGDRERRIRNEMQLDAAPRAFHE